MENAEENYPTGGAFQGPGGRNLKNQRGWARIGSSGSSPPTDARKGMQNTSFARATKKNPSAPGRSGGVKKAARQSGVLSGKNGREGRFAEGGIRRGVSKPRERKDHRIGRRKNERGAGGGG